MFQCRFALPCVLFWAVGTFIASAEASEPARIGTEAQLFVDDVLVASKAGVVRTAHACRKLPQPVLVPERPWEGDRVYTYGTVLYDPAQQQFRMWYMGLAPPAKLDPQLNHTNGDVVLYATSRDGVQWERPNLGLYRYDGSAENNIVFDLHSPSVVFNPQEPDPAKRYKMVGVRKKGQSRGYWAACSEDGLHWSDASHDAILTGGDTVTLMHDPRSGEDFVFHKINTEHRGHRRRLVYLATSKDFEHWSPAELVLAPDEQDDRWVTEPKQGTQFYNMSAFVYGSQYLGLATAFRLQRYLQNTQPHQSSNDGPIEAQLVHSRDGRTWNRCEDRSPVIPNGPHGYDAGCILGVSNVPVIHGDEVWFYYTAINTTHGGALPVKKVTIARAAWRLDGFVSLDAGQEEAVMETVPLRFDGGTMILNADAAGGSIVVEVLDAEGQPLPGYSRQDGVAIETDSVRHQVRWKEKSALPADRPVRIRFLLRNSRLYSFCQET